jgi:aromatic ring-opening dioxygenase LigB subunit
LIPLRNNADRFPRVRIDADTLRQFHPFRVIVEFGEIICIVFIRKLIINIVFVCCNVDRGWETNFPKKVRRAAEEDHPHDDPFPKFKKDIAI